MILITDGEQNEGKPAVQASQALQAEGAIIFGIGVGSQISAGSLQKWVSLPVSEHYFGVSAFSSLNTILQKIVAGACPHPP